MWVTTSLKGGRPPLLASEPKLILAKKLYADKTLSIDDVCQTLKISRSTYYRYVARHDASSGRRLKVHSRFNHTSMQLCTFDRLR